METLLGEVSELSNQNSNLLHRLKKWKGLFVRSKLVKSSQSSYFGHRLRNKHCAILVSCSDKERNCIQAHETSCKFMEFHVSSGNCMQAYVTFAFWNILQAFWNILDALWNILHFCMHSGTFCIHCGTFCMHSGTFCIHSGTFCMHFGTFCMHSGTFWNILEHFGTFWNILELYRFAHCERILIRDSHTHTDRQTDIRTCWAASLQLKTISFRLWNFGKTLFQA